MWPLVWCYVNIFPAKFVSLTVPLAVFSSSLVYVFITILRTGEGCLVVRILQFHCVFRPFVHIFESWRLNEITDSLLWTRMRRPSQVGLRQGVPQPAFQSRQPVGQCGNRGGRPRWHLLHHHHTSHRHPRSVQRLRSNGVPLPCGFLVCIFDRVILCKGSSVILDRASSYYFLT